jgi:hypothetical protein
VIAEVENFGIYLIDIPRKGYNFNIIGRIVNFKNGFLNELLVR